MSKACWKCGREMKKDTKVYPSHISRRDFKQSTQTKKGVQELLRVVETPNWICWHCIEEAEKGPFVPLKKAACDMLGCTKEELEADWKRMKRERTEEDEIICITADELRKMLEEWKDVE